MCKCVYSLLCHYVCLQVILSSMRGVGSTSAVVDEISSPGGLSGGVVAAIVIVVLVAVILVLIVTGIIL